MNCGWNLPKVRDTRGQASRNCASPAPGGSGMLSLVPSALPLPVSLGMPGARIQVAAVLVYVGEDQLGILSYA